MIDSQTKAYSLRCQRECSRTVHEYSQENTFVHLRGLALFTAELYLECKAPELAEHLPNLLQIILSSNINVDANVKCACQTLKVDFFSIFLFSFC